MRDVMKNKIVVIDDIISPVVQNDMEDYFSSADFPWYYNPSANYGSLDDKHIREEEYLKLKQNSNYIDTPQFTHTIFNSTRQQISQIAYQAFSPILMSLPFSITKLIRIKLNLTYKHNEMFGEKHGIPHVDFIDTEGLVTIIYYINDSDGDTIIFNEKKTSSNFIHSDNLTIKQKIKPKKGRCIIFDGTYIHAGNNPSTDNPRIVANINILPYKVYKLEK
jgi:hypothetical protein